jgi:hypothetical protein
MQQGLPPGMRAGTATSIGLAGIESKAGAT